MTYYGPQQQAPKAPKWKRWQKVVVGISFLLIGLICCGAGLSGALSDNHKSSPVVNVKTVNPPVTGTSAAAKSEAKAAPAKTTEDAPQVFEAGTYEVGKKSSPDDGTIKPGTFVLITPDHCYWERVKSFDGDFDSIIANDNLESSGGRPAQARVTIKKSDKGFTLSGNCILGQKGGLK